MALRILPFRQYNETDVINMFALESGFVNDATTSSSFGDAGVFVTVSAGDFNADTITYSTDSYLGKTDYPFVGANQYPSVTLKVKPAASGDVLLGLTLNQTAKTDENGEKLLYYPQKRAELQCVLPGQAVPIATKGVFTVTSGAFVGALGVGSGFKLASGSATFSGRITGCAATDGQRVGMVLGTGSRASGSTPDQFAGTFAIIALGL